MRRQIAVSPAREANPRAVVEGSVDRVSNASLAWRWTVDEIVIVVLFIDLLWWIRR
jgi:hypothetical protein